MEARAATEGTPPCVGAQAAIATPRKYEFDAIRFVAISFVVLVHSLVVIGSEAGHIAQWYRLGAQTLFFTGNALFFLMSGHFNLRPAKEGDTIWSFYSSKLRNIVLPALLVFVGRSLLDWHASGGPGSFAHVLAHNLLSSQGYASIEYWFVYALLGYLVVSPFVRRIFSELSAAERRAFLVMGLVYQAYVTLSANLGHETAFSLPISGFFFVYCLGAFADGEVSGGVCCRWLVPLGAVCLLLSVLLIHWGYGEHAQDTSPLFIVASLGLYAALLRAFRGRKANALVILVARHSFSVYLLHMMVLVPLSRLPQLQGLRGGWAIAGSLLLATVVFGVSLALSIILDETVVKAAKAAYDRLFARQKKV